MLTVHVEKVPSDSNKWLRERVALLAHYAQLRYLFLLDEHSTGGWHTVIFPLWMPAVFVTLPTAILWMLDRRRIPAGHCRKCGYDLTGNVSGRCPECGTPCEAAPQPRR